MLERNLSMVTTTKHLWSASRYDTTSGLYNIGFVCLDCISCLSFLFFSFKLVKTDSLQGASFDIYLCKHLFNAGF